MSNRLCVKDYDALTVFTAPPAEGRESPAPLPQDVRLFFRDMDITSRIVGTVQTDMIRFTLPPGSPSGAVYLRGPLQQFESFPVELAQVCGGEPQIPRHWLVPEAPGAVLWIVQAQDERTRMFHERGRDAEDAGPHGIGPRGCAVSAHLGLEGEHEVPGDRGEPGANLVVHHAVVAHERAARPSPRA